MKIKSLSFFWKIAFVVLPTLRIPNSMMPGRLGVEDRQKGDSPTPGKDTIINWPGLYVNDIARSMFVCLTCRNL
jgi:hypothetical protein